MALHHSSRNSSEFNICHGLQKQIVKMKLFNLSLVFIKPLMKEMKKIYLMNFSLIHIKKHKIDQIPMNPIFESSF